MFSHFFQRTNEADFYPVHLPDDVPVDFLEGNMDLIVTLPTQKIVRMSVERRWGCVSPRKNPCDKIIFFRTPMMDLLVQITTAHRISPGGHVIQVMNERSDDFLYYKPSTPIGKWRHLFIIQQDWKDFQSTRPAEL